MGDYDNNFICITCGSPQVGKNPHRDAFIQNGQGGGGNEPIAPCKFCFAGEVELITWDGIKTFKECVDTIQTLLVSKANMENGKPSSSFYGQWIDARIESFGIQELVKITITRQGKEKDIFATPEHRWILSVHHDGNKNGKTKVVTTSQLRVGDRLASLYPQNRLKIRKTRPSPQGIAHGFVFGDGVIVGGRRNEKSTSTGAEVVCWGEKDAAMVQYFSMNPKREIKSLNGAKGTLIRDLPRYFKDFPTRSESLSYLYGFLVGYFAADGSVSKKDGSLVISSAKKENLEFVQNLCSQLGIGTYAIGCQERKGYGETLTNLYNLRLIRSTVPDNFCILSPHRELFLRFPPEKTPPMWSVKEVVLTDRVEEVYCAVVDDYHNFTLADNIQTMNCGGVVIFVDNVEDVESILKKHRGY